MPWDLLRILSFFEYGLCLPISVELCVPRLNSQSWQWWGTGEMPSPQAVTTLTVEAAASPASASMGDPHMSQCWTPSCSSIWEHSHPLSLSRQAARKSQKSLPTVICYLTIHVPEPASSESLLDLIFLPGKRVAQHCCQVCFVIASHCCWILQFIPYQAVHHSSVLCFSKCFGKHMVWMKTAQDSSTVQYCM